MCSDLLIEIWQLDARWVWVEFDLFSVTIHWVTLWYMDIHLPTSASYVTNGCSLIFGSVLDRNATSLALFELLCIFLTSSRTSRHVCNNLKETWDPVNHDSRYSGLQRLCSSVIPAHTERSRNGTLSVSKFSCVEMTSRCVHTGNPLTKPWYLHVYRYTVYTDCAD